MVKAEPFEYSNIRNVRYGGWFQMWYNGSQEGVRIYKSRNYSLAYGGPLSDTPDSPPVVTCVHHWIIKEQSEGQAMGICKKCCEE